MGKPIVGFSRVYRTAERVSDAVIHVLGLALAFLSVPVLVTLSAVWRGDLPAVAGTLIYGTTLIAMLLCSALYHLIPAPAWKDVLRRLDHSAIYFKIAGTYTPFTLLSGGHGAVLLTGLWGAAIAGCGLKIFAPVDRFRWIALALYLAMGWAGIVAGWSLFGSLSAVVFSLILIGGLIYTAGIVFFLWEVLPYHNTVWHAFVLAASIVFFAAVTTHLAQTSIMMPA